MLIFHMLKKSSRKRIKEAVDKVGPSKEYVDKLCASVSFVETSNIC